MSSTIAERLRTSKAIAAVIASPGQRAGRLLVVHTRPRTGQSVRMAVVASRRVGTAVRRNRAKRLLREAARSVSWRPGTDVVLVARRGCATSGMREVQTEMTALGKGLGVVAESEEAV